MPPPAFLPAQLANNGDWNALVALAYPVFQQTLLGQNIQIAGCSVEVTTKAGFDGKEEGFWHLVTRDDYKAKARVADPARAVRLPWVRSLIDNYKDPAVTYFIYLEGNGYHRHYLWLKAEDYVVILEQQKQRAFLVTAFCIDEGKKRLDLLRKFQKRTP